MANSLQDSIPPFVTPKNKPFADLEYGQDGKDDIEVPAMHPAYLASSQQNGFASSFSGSQSPHTGLDNGFMDFAMSGHNNATSFSPDGGWDGLPRISTAHPSSPDPLMSAPLSSSGPAFSSPTGKSPEISFEFTEFLRDTDDEA